MSKDDKDLKDQLNKNYNAVVDRAFQDIKAEIRKLATEGGKISLATLVKATISTNAKYRCKQGISAFEMHTSRSQDKGSNLLLDDDKLFSDQILSQKSQPALADSTSIKVGDTVTPLSSQPKHKVREMYMVTHTKPEKVSAQRIIHPLSSTPL